MFCTCSTHARPSPAVPTLWAVKTYLDLIDRPDALAYGSGLKRLYTLQAGLDSLNDDDIEKVTAKAIRLGLIPNTLGDFLNQSIIKNCYIYATVLSDLIQARVVSIANGDVYNEDTPGGIYPNRTRKAFYNPPITFLKRLAHVLDSGVLTSITIEDITAEAILALSQYQVSDGVQSQAQTSYALVVSCMEKLLSQLQYDLMYEKARADYRLKARYILKIMWVLAKFLHGDLSTKPSRETLQTVDLSERLSYSDGTLAAIPFPLKQTLEVFKDTDPIVGISMKGRYYLSAVSTAAFHRCPDESEG